MDSGPRTTPCPSVAEFALDCSCPDGAVPCKHLAAAFYLLAERFDQGPFAILAWRGREQEDLLAHIEAARGGPVAADASASNAPPLEDRIDDFFAVQGPYPEDEAPTEDAGHVLAHLPEVDVEVHGRTIGEPLVPAYEAFGASGDEAGAADGVVGDGPGGDDEQ
jgi:uncharacterized Zn finger protein